MIHMKCQALFSWKKKEYCIATILKSTLRMSTTPREIAFVVQYGSIITSYVTFYLKYLNFTILYVIVLFYYLYLMSSWTVRH